MGGAAWYVVPQTWWSRQFAYPCLVTVMVWLGQVTVACRVLVGMVPAVWVETGESIGTAVRCAFALSGILGLALMGCLMLNLYPIWRIA